LNMLRALIKEIGLDPALNAVRPYSSWWGANLGKLGAQRFNLKYDSSEEVAMPYYWIHCASSSGDLKPMVIGDGAAYVEVNFCPVQQLKGLPETCITMSHMISEGLCNTVNPDYEYIWTHHLPNNDGRCRYVVKKKLEHCDLNGPGKIEKIIPVLDLPQTEVETIQESITLGYWNIYTSAAIDTIGPDRTLEIIAPFISETGRRLGRNLINDQDDHTDPSYVREKLDFLCRVLKQDGPPCALDGTMMEKVVVDCPFMKGSPVVCHQVEGLFKGVLETMNPDLEFNYDRMMTEGAKSCHWTVKKR
jgi:predicted hydrocarbon binding protein